MSTFTFRLAKETDTEAILKIYAPYVKDTSITFEYDVPSAEEFRKRIEHISPEYPYIVCEIDGSVVGYAYAHRHMERAAYQWNAELSVYIDRMLLRGGLGKALYGVLIEILKLQNVRNVYGCVTSPNENSEKLHERFGFKKLGIFHNAGYKCGAWHDVSWFEMSIGKYDNDPKPFMPIKEVDKKMIDKILNRASSALLSR
jgi:phosphinothricin acetyltransferase